MAESANQTVVPNEPPPAVAYSRKNPFPGRLLVNRRLNSPDSEKDTRHFEISIEGSGLTYEVGDSMAVYPTNDPDLVDEILEALDAKGDEEIAGNRGMPTTLREGLLRDYSITQVTPKFLKAIAQRASAAPLLNELLGPTKTRPRDLPLGFGSYRFPGRTSVDNFCAPRIRRAPPETAASALLHRLEPEGVP